MQSADILSVAAVCTDLTADRAVPAVCRPPLGDGAVVAVYMVLVDPLVGGDYSW